MSYQKLAGVPHLYMRNGRYFFKRKFKGKIAWVPLRATTLSDAKLELADHVVSGATKAPAKRNIRVDDAWNKFIEVGHGSRRVLADSTKADYESVYKHYVQTKLGTMRVADVEVDHILKVREIALRVSPERWRHAYVALNSFFQKLTEPGEQYVRPDNPVRSLGFTMRPKQAGITPVAKEAVIEQGDIDAIAEHTLDTSEGYKAKVIFLLLAELGLRIGEILALEIGDIHYAKRLRVAGELPQKLAVERQLAFRFKSGDRRTWFAPLKGRTDISGSQERVLGLSPFAARTLQEYLDHAYSEGWIREGETALVFPNSLGKPMRGNHVWARLQDAAEAAGVRKVTLHWLRHTFASNQAASGTDIKHLRDALGHSSVAVTEKRYAHRGEDAPYIAAIARGGRQ